MTQTSASAPTVPQVVDKKLWFSSWLTSLFGWYDFFAYLIFSAQLKMHFYSKLDAATSNTIAIILFLIGFVFRPIGGVYFGRLSDRVGRKYSFMFSIILLGGTTCLVSVLPGYETLGLAAPIILICLRSIQGFALGGECSAIFTYLNEMVPGHKRGRTIAMVQGTAALGLATCWLSYLLMDTFAADLLKDWGWRIPFMASIPFLIISLLLRLSMKETPVFVKLKLTGQLSPSPLKEFFSTPSLIWHQILGVIVIIPYATTWYTGHVYAMGFLKNTMQLDPATVNWLFISAMYCAYPAYYIFGRLGDVYGRKKILVINTIIFTAGVFAAFSGLIHFSEPKLEKAVSQAPIRVSADNNTCNLAFDLLGNKKYETTCDNLRLFLMKRGFSFQFMPDYPGMPTVLTVGDEKIEGFNPEKTELALVKAGYPGLKDKRQPNTTMLFWILFLMSVGAASLGSASTLLSEMFPARVRGLGVAVPYNIANGWVGGFVPILALTLSVAYGDILSGLWFCVILWIVCAVLTLLFVSNRRPVDE